MHFPFFLFVGFCVVIVSLLIPKIDFFFHDLPLKKQKVLYFGCLCIVKKSFGLNGFLSDSLILVSNPITVFIETIISTIA